MAAKRVWAASWWVCIGDGWRDRSALSVCTARMRGRHWPLWGRRRTRPTLLAQESMRTVMERLPTIMPTIFCGHSRFVAVLWWAAITDIHKQIVRDDDAKTLI